MASSGPITAPAASPARSMPKARPCASFGAPSAISTSRAGPRLPRPIHAATRHSSTCHAAVQRPMPAVPTAVTRYPTEASGFRRRTRSAATPPQSLRHRREPVGAALDPAQGRRPRAEGHEESRQDRGGQLVRDVGEAGSPARLPAWCGSASPSEPTAASAITGVGVAISAPCRRSRGSVRAAYLRTRTASSVTRPSVTSSSTTGRKALIFSSRVHDLDHDRQVGGQLEEPRPCASASASRSPWAPGGRWRRRGAPRARAGRSPRRADGRVPSRGRSRR